MNFFQEYEYNDVNITESISLLILLTYQLNTHTYTSQLLFK